MQSCLVCLFRRSQVSLQSHFPMLPSVVCRSHTISGFHQNRVSHCYSFLIISCFFDRPGFSPPSIYGPQSGPLRDQGTTMYTCFRSKNLISWVQRSISRNTCWWDWTGWTNSSKWKKERMNELNEIFWMNVFALLRFCSPIYMYICNWIFAYETYCPA